MVSGVDFPKKIFTNPSNWGSTAGWDSMSLVSSSKSCHGHPLFSRQCRRLGEIIKGWVLRHLGHLGNKREPKSIMVKNSPYFQYIWTLPFCITLWVLLPWTFFAVPVPSKLFRRFIIRSTPWRFRGSFPRGSLFGVYIEAHRGSASSVASACHQEDLGMSFAVLMLVASRTIFYLGIFGIFWVWKFKQDTLNILKHLKTFYSRMRWLLCSMDLSCVHLWSAFRFTNLKINRAVRCWKYRRRNSWWLSQ